MLFNKLSGNIDVDVEVVSKNDGDGAVKHVSESDYIIDFYAGFGVCRDFWSQLAL